VVHQFMEKFVAVDMGERFDVSRVMFGDICYSCIASLFRCFCLRHAASLMKTG
jgi:hypothetical protein